MMTLLISLMILLSSFIVMPKSYDIFRYPKEFVSILFMLLIIWYSTSKYLLRCPNKYLLLVPVIAFFGLIFNPWKIPMLFVGNELANIGGNDIGIPIQIIAMKEIFYFTIGVFAIWSISSAQFNMKIISDVIKWTLIVLIAYGILQAFGMDEFFSGHGDRPHWRHIIGGTIGNPSLYGLYLAMLAPVCLYLRTYCLYALSGIMILLTASIVAIIGYIIGGLLWLVIKNRKVGVLTIIILAEVLFGYVYYKGFHPTKNDIINSIKSDARYALNKLTFDDIKNKAITGYGAGTYEYRFGNHPSMKYFSGERAKEAHFELLQIWSCIGIVGLIAFALAVFWFIKYMVRNIKYERVLYTSCCLVVVFLQLFTWFPLRFPPISTFTVVLLGILLNEN